MYPQLPSFAGVIIDNSIKLLFASIASWTKEGIETVNQELSGLF